MKKLRKNLYTVENLVYKDCDWQYVQNVDGTLFSGRYHTKIKPTDLPEWYIYGRYYKRFGYLSAKGITDMLYLPSHFANHFLKDDSLYILYGGRFPERITDSEDLREEKHIGYDERVSDGEILTILKAAQVYSSFDISEIIMQLKEKQAWLKQRYPESAEGGNIDLDEFFDKELSTWDPYRKIVK